MSYDADRPSEALEVARTPMRLINGLFTGFSKIVSLRTGRNEQLSALSASELATLQTLERDRATVEAYRVCAAAKRAEGESVLPCLDKVE